ncbi:MAG: glycosyl hydrolase [Bryobacteraceae bacterium]
MTTLLLSIALLAPLAAAADPALEWPRQTRESRPWSYWWWMASAVDEANITRELEQYKAAGWGGLHIIPIYGAKGFEQRYIEYLSPRWMQMLAHTVREAERLGMGIDMTTGSGWCFGGPSVKGDDVCLRLAPTASDPLATRACSLNVKRAGPGGQGPMLDPFSAVSVQHYVDRFSEAFAGWQGPKPRAQYHDSFEYQANWTRDLPEEFARRRGYRIEDHANDMRSDATGETAARVKSDYRETLSDLMVERFAATWVGWAHKQGFLTRNQAHGSPANLLDLYGAVDIPETEMFHGDRQPLISRMASSAAHVTGRRLVSSETGTWLREHFNETLADMKDLVDQLFTAGVNHVLYHGSCFSPEDAKWPGWLFYASTEMNPRNPFWRDVPALNAYIARVQSVLQDGKSDNDFLLYWPVYDVWHNAAGLNINKTVHRREWLEAQPVGELGQRLSKRGWTFDFVSDRQLAKAEVRAGRVVMPGNEYRLILAPPTKHMPLATMEKLLALARSGATVIFADRLPDDVPGLHRVEERRAELRRLLADAKRVIVGDVETSLQSSGLQREQMADRAGLEFIRRRGATGVVYFIANRGKSAVEGWLPLAASGRSAVVLDPMTGRAGRTPLRRNGRSTEVYLDMPAGASAIVRILDRAVEGPAFPYWQSAGEAVAVKSAWKVDAVAGGPAMPASFEAQQLESWTVRGGDWEPFGGTAVYSTLFDAPRNASSWALDLGRVAESARVKVNGAEVATVFQPPYRVVISGLRPTGNRLEVEVTNLAANRIRDMDRRKIPWRVFHDINLVNLDYKPFDASVWPVRESGLIGPVTLQPLRAVTPR